MDLDDKIMLGCKFVFIGRSAPDDDFDGLGFGGGFEFGRHGGGMKKNV